jgi:AMP-activated protein kinase-like protein
MTSPLNRIVLGLFLLVLLPGVAAAQGLSRLEVGASVRGSVFGWLPRFGVSGELPAPLGNWARFTIDGGFAQLDSTTAARSELRAGARLSTANVDAGWWLGSDVVRRVGLSDLVEQPRISAGGWRRMGPFLVGVAASRRSAQLNEMKHSDRSVVTYFSYLDSLTGRWDSTAHMTTVTDSARSSEGRLWMETEGTLAWEARRLAVQLTLGGRVATHNVPGGAWAGAEIAVILARPLSLVLGAGTASGSRFALDAEHHYLTLGFRLRPPMGTTLIARPEPVPVTMGPLAVDALSPGHYRLSVWAPRAHAMEIAGDFTGWKPRPLTRGEAGEWSLTLALLPGAHHLNACVDGGAWIVPPGLTTMTDDFAGEVGVLVIESDPSGGK